MKLSDFGILRMEFDFAVMTDCQYGGTTMYIMRCVRDDYNRDDYNVKKLSYNICISKQCNLSCVTDFNLSYCHSLYSIHLEQLAIACLIFRD